MKKINKIKNKYKIMTTTKLQIFRRECQLQVKGKVVKLPSKSGIHYNHFVNYYNNLLIPGYFWNGSELCGKFPSLQLRIVNL